MKKTMQKKPPPKKILPLDCMPDYSIFIEKKYDKIPPPDCFHMPEYFFRKEKPPRPPRKYCPMYPQDAECCVDRITPNFDHIKTLYTKCDYQLEACVHEQLLRINTSLKGYAALLRPELLKQSDLIERVTVLVQRYKQLTEAGVCIKLYPEMVSVTVEQTTLCHLKEFLKSIHKSNCRLEVALAEIAKEIEELELRYKRLDLTVESVFLTGDWRHPSYYAMRRLVDDLYENYSTFLERLKYAALLLQATDLGAAKAYRALLLPQLLERREHNIAFLDGYGECMNMRNGYLKCWRR